MTLQVCVLIGVWPVGGLSDHTAVILECEKALFSERVQAAGLFAALNSRAPKLQVQGQREARGQRLLPVLIHAPRKPLAAAGTCAW